MNFSNCNCDSKQNVHNANKLLENTVKKKVIYSNMDGQSL